MSIGIGKLAKLMYCLSFPFINGAFQTRLGEFIGKIINICARLDWKGRLLNARRNKLFNKMYELESSIFFVAAT